MSENPESMFIKVDMNGSPIEADCLDCLVAFPIGIERMRAERDDFYIPDAMMGHTREAFDTLDDRGGDIRIVAMAAQDLLYQQIARLKILDYYTKAYVDKAPRHLFSQLTSRAISTYFILDNSLRDDRFGLLLHLFDLAGVTVVTPRIDGKEWQRLSSRIRAALAANRHVAYVEPDAEVNHLDAAKGLASECSCVATFRNLAPENPQLQVISLPRPSP